MKVAVCFKIITDYDQVPSNSWRADGLLCCGGPGNTRYVKKIFGFFDEGALETGLRIKDSDSSVYIEAVSLGKEDRIFTEALYAAGYDKVTYLEANSDFDSENTAKELGDYVGRNFFDLILTGEAVGPLDSGSVPYYMADYIGCHIISNVSDACIDNNCISITRETQNFFEEYICEPDGVAIVAVISNAKHPYLRFASYDKKEKAKSIAANCISARPGKKQCRLFLPQSKDKNTVFTDKEFLAKLLLKQDGGDAL